MKENVNTYSTLEGSLFALIPAASTPLSSSARALLRLALSCALGPRLGEGRDRGDREAWLFGCCGSIYC